MMKRLENQNGLPRWQAGEAAITMTLIGLGLMAVGVLIGVLAVKYTPLRSLLKAQEYELEDRGDQVGEVFKANIKLRSEADNFVKSNYPNTVLNPIQVNERIQTEGNGYIEKGSEAWKVTDINDGTTVAILEGICANEARLWQKSLDCNGFHLQFRTGTGGTRADWSSGARRAFEFKADLTLTAATDQLTVSLQKSFVPQESMDIPFPPSAADFIRAYGQVQATVSNIDVGPVRPWSLVENVSNRLDCPRTETSPTPTTATPAGEPSNTPEPTRPIGGNPTPAACPPLPDVSLGLPDCANREVFNAAPVGVQLVQTADNYLEVSWSAPINQISDQNYRLVQYRIAVFDGDPAQGARPIFNTQVAWPNTTLVRFGPFDRSAYPGQTLYATVRAIYRDVTTDGCPGCRSNYAWGTLTIPQPTPTETPIPSATPALKTYQADAGGGHSAWADAACNLEPNVGDGTTVCEPGNRDNCVRVCQGQAGNNVVCAVPTWAPQQDLFCDGYTCNFCASDPNTPTVAQCDRSNQEAQRAAVGGTIDWNKRPGRTLRPGESAVCNSGDWSGGGTARVVAISVPDVMCDDKVNATHWSYAIANFGREVPTCQGKTLVNALVLSRIIVSYQKAQ